jgi:hypothetical protein
LRDARLSPKLAKILGRVFQPAVPGFFVALKAALDWQGGITPLLLEATLVISASAIGLPLLSLFFGHRLGVTPDDLWVDRRENRWFFYPALATGIALAAALLWDRYAYPLGFRMAIVAMIVLVPMAIANRWLKVSIHTSGNAGVATAATWVYGVAAAPLFLLVPIVGWARYTTGHHTRDEVLVGAAIGTFATALGLGLVG